LPLSISGILNGIVTQFQNFLVAIYVTNQLIGNYSIATNFAVLITFFATPITTVLFPAFSKLNAQKEKEMLGNVFQFSVKYAALLVVPATTLIIVLSQPAIFTLFGEKYAEAPLYLSLYAMIYLYSAIGSLSNGPLINSQGKTKTNLKLNLVTLATALPLSIILIPTYEITGLITTTLVSRFPSTVIGLWWIKTHLVAKINLSSSARILLSSTLAATITYIAISQLSQSPWIILITGTLIFLATYMIAVPLMGAINKTDIQNLKEMLKALGPLAPILNTPLNIIEKLTTKLQKP
jgi:O-antigen/teichoic acid export membrane protein